jgi:hypothetical protein
VIVSSPKQQEIDAFDAYNHDIDGDADNDELARYLREECAPQGTRPLTWWREHHHRFPVLRHLAFEVLAVLASSSADERVFSMTRDVVNDVRPNKLEELVEAYQGLRS